MHKITYVSTAILLVACSGDDTVKTSTGPATTDAAVSFLDRWEPGVAEPTTMEFIAAARTEAMQSPPRDALIEEARVQSVTDDTLHVYLRTWTAAAGVNDWSAGMPESLTPDEAKRYAAAALAACVVARGNAPAHEWTAQWDATAGAVQAAQAEINNPPLAWQVFWPQVSDAVWACAYAAASGASFVEAFASLQPTIISVTNGAKNEFRELMTIR